MNAVWRFALLLTVTTLVGCAIPRSLIAQSATDLGAWYAIMLSPAGALPPQVSDPARADTPLTELALRFGYWRYDLNDVPHNNIGATLSRPAWASGTRLSFTGAYLKLGCGCPSFLLGGVDLESRLWSRERAEAPDAALAASVGARASVGGARYTGAGHSTAGSAAAVLVATVGVPVAWQSRLTASVQPGVGFGRIVSPDLAAQGLRAMLGVALAWRFRSGLGIELGRQSVAITRGPAQLGGGISWLFN